MKETFYFSHDYHARHDPKLVKLRMEKGIEAVGAYWCIIEMLFEEGGYLKLSECGRIAFELQTNIELINYIIHTDLFKIASDAFTGSSVIERLDMRKSKSKKAKNAATVRWKKHHADALRMHTGRNASAMPIKESKGKEIKENNISPNGDIEKSSETTKKVFGNEEINKILLAIKLKVGCEDFKESQQQQRQWGKNLHALMLKVGIQEFARRLDFLLADNFKAKNCGSLQFIYREIKGFIEPKNQSITSFS